VHLSLTLNNKLLPVVSFAIIAVTILLEHLSPTGIYLGCGYVTAVILTVFSETKLTSIIAAVLSSIAILLSVFYLHADEDFFVTTTNHACTLIGVMMAMFFVLQVKNIQEKHEEGTKQIQALFLHATEGILLTNRDGTIILSNPFAQHLFGYTEDELKNMNVDMLLPDAARGKHAQHRTSFHNNPVNRVMGSGRDLYAARKNGTVFPVEISLSHYRYGRESYVIAFIIDITIRKQNEAILKLQQDELSRVSEQIKQMNTELEQKVADRTMMLRETLAQLERSKDELYQSLEKEKELGDLKSRFVSTVSHEFRTPLSTILSSASLIARYPLTEDAEKRARHIIRIKESVLHMNAMLEDLLSLGKLEEGLVTVKPEALDIPSSINDFLSEVRETGKPEQPIHYTHKGDNTFTTDKRLVKLILINLLSNAIKFSTGTEPIDVVSIVENGTFSIAVSDHGIGISEEDQQHLFERFFRAKNATNIQGTGLGLHIISKYLELLKGTVQVSSQLGVGTTFTVQIPSVYTSCFLR